MGDDIGLQKAIMASLQNNRGPAAGATRSAPTSMLRNGIAPTQVNPRGGGGSSSSRGGPAWGANAPPAAGPRVVRQVAPLGHPASAGGAGRKDNLRREGIVPRDNSSQAAPARPPALPAPARGRALPDSSSRVPSSRNVPIQRRLETPVGEHPNPIVRDLIRKDRNGVDSAKGTPTEGRRSSQSSVSNTVGARKVGNWIQRGGSGIFQLSQDGGSGFIEASSSKMCLATFEPENGSSSVAQGNYTLAMEFKCEHAAPNSGMVPAFTLLLEVHQADGTDRLGLKVDTVQRTWTLETMTVTKDKNVKKEKKETAVIAEQNDVELRPGVWHTLRLEMRGGNTVSVFADKRNVFTKVPVPSISGSGVTGPLGLAVVKSKLHFKSWNLSGGGGDWGMKHAQEPYTGDDQALVATIEQDILDRDLGVTFDDIASLSEAKNLLNEAVMLPLIIPEFFTGIREPWKGVLLFGPPGTGKTLLAKAVAGTGGVKFFNCSASTLMSKWRGESEKLVRVLFNMARHYAPSIIFFDEADALLSSRGGDTEHEASRRFKSELLSQMDGIPSSASESNPMVMVLATSNCPWDLDEALRRRLEKRIYIPLPDATSRHDMFKIHLKGVNVGEQVDFKELVRLTDGYSGADIKVVCRDASMMPMRRLISHKSPNEIKAMKEEGSLDVTLEMADFREAIGRTQPSVGERDVNKYVQWSKEYGST